MCRVDSRFGHFGPFAQVRRQARGDPPLRPISQMSAATSLDAGLTCQVRYWGRACSWVAFRKHLTTSCQAWACHNVWWCRVGKNHGDETHGGQYPSSSSRTLVQQREPFGSSLNGSSEHRAPECALSAGGNSTDSIGTPSSCGSCLPNLCTHANHLL